MRIITLLKLMGAGILALLAGLFGLNQGKRSAKKEIEKSELEVAASIAREQAAIKQSLKIIEAFEKEKEPHEQTVAAVKKFIETKKQIEIIQEEADEKTDTIINADITDKLKFMRNSSTGDHSH